MIEDKTGLYFVPLDVEGEFAIPSSVTTIGNYAFYQDFLTEVVIPASVRTIGSGAFQSNYHLASVTIGSGVETIGDNAFQNDALTEIATVDNNGLVSICNKIKGEAKITAQ